MVIFVRIKPTALDDPTLYNILEHKIKIEDSIGETNLLNNREAD